jgi:metal-responsive CopG/Arc/MetJ family transcriptional regulator
MKKSPRRATAKAKSRAIIVYFPEELIRLLEAASLKTESDRSKFIRAAVEEKLKTIGS